MESFFKGLQENAFGFCRSVGSIVARYDFETLQPKPSALRSHMGSKANKQGLRFMACSA